MSQPEAQGRLHLDWEGSILTDTNVNKIFAELRRFIVKSEIIPTPQGCSVTVDFLFRQTAREAYVQIQGRLWSPSLSELTWRQTPANDAKQINLRYVSLRSQREEPPAKKQKVEDPPSAGDDPAPTSSEPAAPFYRPQPPPPANCPAIRHKQCMIHLAGSEKAINHSQGGHTVELSKGEDAWLSDIQRVRVKAGTQPELTEPKVERLRYFRIHILSQRYMELDDGRMPCVELSGLEIQLTNDPLPEGEEAVGIRDRYPANRCFISPVNRLMVNRTFPAREGYDRKGLIEDGEVLTLADKHRVWWEPESHPILAVDYGRKEAPTRIKCTSFPLVLTLDLGEEKDCCGYAMRTGRMHPGRDPTSWWVEGSSDMQTWNTLHFVSQHNPSPRRGWRAFYPFEGFNTVFDTGDATESRGARQTRPHLPKGSGLIGLHSTLKAKRRQEEMLKAQQQASMMRPQAPMPHQMIPGYPGHPPPHQHHHPHPHPQHQHQHQQHQQQQQQLSTLSAMMAQPQLMAQVLQQQQQQQQVAAAAAAAAAATAVPSLNAILAGISSTTPKPAPPATTVQPPLPNPPSLPSPKPDPGEVSEPLDLKELEEFALEEGLGNVGDLKKEDLVSLMELLEE